MNVSFMIPKRRYNMDLTFLIIVNDFHRWAKFSSIKNHKKPINKHTYIWPIGREKYSIHELHLVFMNVQKKKSWNDIIWSRHWWNLMCKMLVKTVFYNEKMKLVAKINNDEFQIALLSSRTFFSCGFESHSVFGFIYLSYTYSNIQHHVSC